MSQNPAQPPERAGWLSQLAQWLPDRDLWRGHEAIEALRIADIKSRWREACKHSGLAPLAFTPSGQHMFFPRIGQVTLGPPTTFTVLPHRGQLLSDFEAASDRIAAAMGVAKVGIRPLADWAPDWIVIELVDGLAEPPPGVVKLSPRPPTGPAPDGMTA
jgi:hypothetical protein